MSNNQGYTPIYWAAHYGHVEIVKILTPLTKNPNAGDKLGNTPIHEAACNGHTEIVKILACLTDNPNAANNDGDTPASVASNEEICRILKSRKRKAGPSAKLSKKQSKKF